MTNLLQASFQNIYFKVSRKYKYIAAAATHFSLIAINFWTKNIKMHVRCKLCRFVIKFSV